MKQQRLRISIIIPTLNNEKDLPILLASIQKQNYPKDLVEIILCDGGSTDRTLDIARSYGCSIYNNKKRLAEFGVSLGFSKAKGDIIIVLAADNELEGDRYFSTITHPFLVNPRIMISYPKQKSGPHDSWVARYINTFTDPINHFMYGHAANTRSFYRTYKIIEENKNFVIYDFSPTDYPMIALAQGTAIRRSWKRSEESMGDDIMTIVEIIQKGYYLAYVPKAGVFHHSTQTLSEFIKKQRWAFDNYLFGKNYGIILRLQYFSPVRKCKKLFWPFYAGSIICPVVVSIAGYVKEKKKEWMYHPILTYIAFLTLVSEFVRVRILGNTKHIVRK